MRKRDKLANKAAKAYILTALWQVLIHISC